MLGVQYHANGDSKKVRAMIRRADPAELQRECFYPFVKWVLSKRIPLMYWNAGRVSGSDGQPAWYALSKWTIASKGVGQFISGAGARGKVTSPMVTAAMRMAQSYDISFRRSSGAVWRFEMTNKARSTSKWSPGFDYPSALHEGWGPYTVKPRPDGPGFLAWPMKQGTVLSGVGRRGTGNGVPTRKGGLVASDWVRAMVTHPKGAPPRPHIRWFAIDVIHLGDIVLAYVFRNQRAAA